MIYKVPKLGTLMVSYFHIVVSFSASREGEDGDTVV